MPSWFPVQKPERTLQPDVTALHAAILRMRLLRPINLNNLREFGQLVNVYETRAIAFLSSQFTAYPVQQAFKIFSLQGAAYRANIGGSSKGKKSQRA